MQSIAIALIINNASLLVVAFVVWVMAMVQRESEREKKRKKKERVVVVVVKRGEEEKGVSEISSRDGMKEKPRPLVGEIVEQILESYISTDTLSHLDTLR